MLQLWKRIKMKRITIDWDTKAFRNKLVRKLFELKVKEIMKIEISRSPSKRGWHLIFWMNTNTPVYELRKILEDDSVRAIYDYVRKETPAQILFIKKGKWKKISDFFQKI